MASTVFSVSMQRLQGLCIYSFTSFLGTPPWPFVRISCNRGICAAAAVLSTEFPFWAVVQKRKQILHRSLTKPRLLKAHRHTVNSVARLEAWQKLYTVPLQGIVHYCGSGPNQKSQCCVKGKEINNALVVRDQAELIDSGRTKWCLRFKWGASARPATSVSLHYDIITCYKRFTCRLPHR